MSLNDNIFRTTVHFVESAIADIYRIDLPVHAQEHFIESSHAFSSLENKRAAVLFEEQEDDFFIGIYLEDKLVEDIIQNEPIHSLNSDNLDSFCVLVEELSHFHFILQRKLTGLRTNNYELELQGEIDKVLIAAKLLYNQVQNTHETQLFHALFNNENIRVLNEEQYQYAQTMAGKIWHEVIEKTKNYNSEHTLAVMTQTARNLYTSGFHEKHSQILSSSYLEKSA